MTDIAQKIDTIIDWNVFKEIDRSIDFLFIDSIIVNDTIDGIIAVSLTETINEVAKSR